jgi:hypothetical protein
MNLELFGAYLVLLVLGVLHKTVHSDNSRVFRRRLDDGTGKRLRFYGFGFHGDKS